MDWHLTVDEKPNPGRAVLGWWRNSKAFLMVSYDRQQWHCTTGPSVPAPTYWAIPEPPI